MAITNLNIRKKVNRLGGQIRAKEIADPMLENTQEIAKLKITKDLYKSVLKTRKR